MQFEIVEGTDPNAGEIFQSFVDNDEFFSRFVEKNNYIRIVNWKNGLLYSTPGNVLGLILAREFDTSEWNISLSWKRQKKSDVLCVHKKGDDDKFWCVQNDYLEHVSELTGKKELTVKFNCHEQLAIIEHNKWVFVLAPIHMDEKNMRYFDKFELKEINSVSLDDLW